MVTVMGTTMLVLAVSICLLERREKYQVLSLLALLVLTVSICLPERRKKCQARRIEAIA